MPDFYKMEPAAWDMGTSSLSLEQEAAYLRIVNCMHIHKSPVPNNDRVLAGLFRTSTRKARSLVSALVDAGKLQIVNDEISNKRAISDLVHRGFVSNSRSESGAKGGRNSAEIKRKSLISKETDQANAYARVVEKSREEYTLPNGSDGQAVNGFPDPVDFASEVFSRGVAFLSRKGTLEKQARAFIGRLRKDYSDAEIFQAFDRCSKAGAVDPIPWITKALQKPPEKVHVPRIDLSRINPDGSYRYDV